MTMGNGRIGTSTTTVKVKRRPKPRATASMCPVCFSVSREPCRKVLGVNDNGVMKRGGVMNQPHPEREP